MDYFNHIDMMARGGAISLLALWSWILLRDHGPSLAARLAVLMNAAICCYLLVTAGWYREPNMFGLFLALGAGATPGLFWLFTRAWFSDEDRVKPGAVLLVALSVINTGVTQLSFPEDGPFNAVSGVLFRVAMLGFAAAAFWEVWKSREGDLVEPRRKMRPRIIAVVGFYVVVIAFAEVAAHNEIADKSIIRIVGSTIILVVLAFCAALFQMRQADLFGPTAPVQRSNLPKAQPDDGLSEKLLAHMAREMAHRDETLSIAKLAQQLGEQEYRLRRTINQQLGHRNFTSFLNGYRLAEVKAALSDPTQRDVPIITIALDAGFGSLGPFNRAFREAEGMTPSAFRALKAG